MEDERLRSELAARRLAAADRSVAAADRSVAAQAEGGAAAAPEATAVAAVAAAPEGEAPDEVACARCGVHDEPDAMLFGADGLICAVCHGEASVDEGLLGRAQLRSPLDPAFLSVLSSAFFWTPIAGPAFVAVGWLFGLLAVRGSVRNVVAAHREADATLGALGLAWLGVVAGLFATGFALQATMWLWQLWVEIGALGA